MGTQFFADLGLALGLGLGATLACVIATGLFRIPALLRLAVSYAGFTLALVPIAGIIPGWILAVKGDDEERCVAHCLLSLYQPFAGVIAVAVAVWT